MRIMSVAYISYFGQDTSQRNREENKKRKKEKKDLTKSVFDDILNMSMREDNQIDYRI